MGPPGASIGMMKRADRAMENRARSIFSRRPNLKHKDKGPQKPGRKFHVQDRSRCEDSSLRRPNSLYFPWKIFLAVFAGLIFALVAQGMGWWS